jgi:hypothetical protein
VYHDGVGYASDRVDCKKQAPVAAVWIEPGTKDWRIERIDAVSIAVEIDDCTGEVDDGISAAGAPCESEDVAGVDCDVAAKEELVELGNDEAELCGAGDGVNEFGGGCDSVTAGGGGGGGGGEGETGVGWESANVLLPGHCAVHTVTPSPQSVK